MINNYASLYNALGQFATGHMEVKRFEMSFAEQIDTTTTSGNTFPVLFCVPQSINFVEGVDRYTIRTYCLDRLSKDRNNEVSILNSTSLILRDLTNWLKYATDTDLGLNNEPIAIPVNNFGTELCTGWYIDYEIELIGQSNQCSIPFDANFVFSGTTC